MSQVTIHRIAGSPAKLALLALGSLAGVLALGTANAASPDEVPSTVVKYGDLSLSTDLGVQMLYQRIVRAAEKVCPDVSIQSLSARVKVHECRKEAVARAIRQIDNSQLAALYAAHSKNS
jgi:UrcA family protein